MRPRGYPAEVLAEQASQALGFNEAAGRTPRKPRTVDPAPTASMRPRGVRPAEAPHHARRVGRHAVMDESASMRPRGVRPAEAPTGTAVVGAAGLPRFNEAAGYVPRKPCVPPEAVVTRSSPSTATGFNEAAGTYPAEAMPVDGGIRGSSASMRPRGVPRGSPEAASGTSRGFNEAAGRTPRKLHAVTVHAILRCASMRPRGVRPAEAVSSGMKREAAGRTPRKPQFDYRRKAQFVHLLQ